MSGTGSPMDGAPGRPVDPADAIAVDPRTLDLLPDGVVITDAAGLLTALNARAAALLETAPGEAVGRPLRTAVPLFDEEGRDWWARTDPFHGLHIRARQPERLLWLADGRPVLVTASYVRASRRLLGLVVALRPATERSRLERRGAELVATAAHELRSPLTGIKGFTSTLLSKWERFTDDQRRLMLETVEADADRLTRLIVELLDVARIDSGRVRLNPNWVDVGDHARQAVARIAAAGGADRVSLSVVDGLPRVWADADKLDQILVNLLENAQRHGAGRTTVVVDGSAILGPAGGRTLANHGGAAAIGSNDSSDSIDGDGVTVAVSDEGPGVPDELAARVFHKYWHAASGGTGLGLYVARGLVEAHGGTIAVDRAPSGGARFRFRLPVGGPDVTG